jgi:hypothetical protein
MFSNGKLMNRSFWFWGFLFDLMGSWLDLSPFGVYVEISSILVSVLILDSSSCFLVLSILKMKVKIKPA